jgi:hypothetical protein
MSSGLNAPAREVVPDLAHGAGLSEQVDMSFAFRRSPIAQRF